ncbi:protein tyrosine kinase [Fragilaria crotonensis]|nr:protein tyrosine kinase [Fragilaria crotonensis]
MPPRTRSRRLATSSDGGLLGVLGSLDAGDQSTNKKPTPTRRVTRKTVAGNQGTIGEDTTVTKSKKPEALQVKARQTRSRKPIEILSSPSTTDEVEDKQENKSPGTRKGRAQEEKPSVVVEVEDQPIVTDNSFKSSQRSRVEKITTTKKESAKAQNCSRQKGKTAAESQFNGTGKSEEKNPPSAVVCSKLSFSSPDGSVLSELSYESQRLTNARDNHAHPKFNRQGFLHEDAPLRPKAIFADEEFSAEGGDEFSASDDTDDDSQESSDESVDDESKKTTEQEHTRSFRESSLEGNGSSGCDESTQEQEFDFDLEEEEPEEEILDDDAADSENFIVDSDEESDFEEDYEIESEEDEDLEVDSENETLHNRPGKDIEISSHKKTRPTKNSAPVAKTTKANKAAVAKGSGDVGNNVELRKEDLYTARQTVARGADIEEKTDHAFGSVGGSIYDEIDDQAFDADSLSHGHNENREKENKSVRAESDYKCARIKLAPCLERSHRHSPVEAGSETEDEESSPGAYSETESVNDQVEVIAQILTDTHIDEDVVDVIAQVVDDTPVRGRSHRDENIKSTEPDVPTDESFFDGDESTLDDGEETLAFDIDDDARSELECGSVSANESTDGLVKRPDKPDYETTPPTEETCKFDDDSKALPNAEENVTISVVSSHDRPDIVPKELDASAIPESTKEETDASLQHIDANMDCKHDHSQSMIFRDQEVVSKGSQLLAADSPKNVVEESFLAVDHTLIHHDKVISHKENVSPACVESNDVIADKLASIGDEGAGNVSTQDKFDEDISSILESTADDTLSMKGIAASSPESSPQSMTDTDHHDSIGASTQIVPAKSWKGTAKSLSADPDQCNENQFNDENPGNKPEKKVRRDGTVRSGKWSLGSKIGTGSFGVVHVGMNTHTGQLMAVKSVELSPAAMKDVQVEVELLKSLSHINIVRYLGAERIAQTLHIFQEWVPGGSVTALLNKFGPFSAAVMRSYLSQILTGLTFLHENRILHRDIKGGNILISDDGIVKLADFGSAKRLAHQQSDMMESLTMRGTPYFMAPEVFEEHYNGKADIWSVGCVAFQMATGLPPWKVEGFSNPMSLFVHLRNSEGLPMLKWPENGPMRESEKAPFEEMLKRCFWRTANQRPTAQGLAADSFFSGASSSEEDASQNHGLFSPGGDSVSTFATKTPRGADTPPLVKLPPRSPFLSPPMPRKIGVINAVNVSPLDRSPKVDAKDWPSWARNQLKTESRSPSAQGEGAKTSPLMDSLAYSADTSNIIANPFARTSQGQGRESLPTLAGLEFMDRSDR